MPKLYELTTQFAELNALAESDDLPDELIADTLEGLQGDLQAKATNVAMLVRNLEAGADAIDEAAKAMQQRANRVRARAERVAAYVLFCMQSAGITKIESPYFVLAVRKNNAAVRIAEGVELPDDYMVQPEPPPPRPDKKKLADALKAGEVIDGVWLEQGERLEIRT